MLSERTSITASILLVAAGLLFPLWPLGLVGILLAAATGRWVTAILLGLLLDIAYGTPVGPLSLLYLPLSVLALGSALLRALAAQYLTPHAPPQTL